MIRISALALFILFGALACSSEGTEEIRTIDGGQVTVIGDACCCSHIVDFDIMVEDLQPIDGCPQLDQGQCILVDPQRLTPHECCPNATGARCGSE
jgi:hypothetical protein